MGKLSSRWLSCLRSIPGDQARPISCSFCGGRSALVPFLHTPRVSPRKYSNAGQGVCSQVPQLVLHFFFFVNSFVATIRQRVGYLEKCRLKRGPAFILCCGNHAALDEIWVS
ncbi:unnamed protein product, partial [Ixodes pacificus]